MVSLYDTSVSHVENNQVLDSFCYEMSGAWLYPLRNILGLEENKKAYSGLVSSHPVLHLALPETPSVVALNPMRTSHSACTEYDRAQQVKGTS